MGEYITAIWGWDEQVQRAFHEGAFTRTDGRSSPLGKPVPACWMPATGPGETCLSRVETHPGHQGHGIGSRIISTLVEEAQCQGQDLVLDGPYTLSDGIAAFARHNELHNGTGEMQPDHT
jgi:GNAT superfamily N-acetyltransferase